MQTPTAVRPTLHWLRLMAMMVVVAFSLSSCTAIKKFLSQDLEDEDFIIGQLYADELVEEKPLILKPKPTTGGKNSKSGITLTDKDNTRLYAAIDDWYGTPYKYGGCDKKGVDCSCFVGNVYRSVYGVNLHRIAADIQKDVSLISRKQLREGDVVFFVNSNGKVSHVGIYLKDDMFVHSSTSSGVMVSSLSSSYWNSHFYKGGRHKQVSTKW